MHHSSSILAFSFSRLFPDSPPWRLMQSPSVHQYQSKFISMASALQQCRGRVLLTYYNYYLRLQLPSELPSSCEIVFPAGFIALLLRERRGNSLTPKTPSSSLGPLDSKCCLLASSFSVAWPSRACRSPRFDDLTSLATLHQISDEPRHEVIVRARI